MEIKCPCLSPDNTEKHHLFRKSIRKRWKGLAVDKIKIYWVRGTKEVSIVIPINAYMKICSICHKLHHPENVSYHLNEFIVVKNLEKKV